jgi:hypothetical protein
VPTWMFDDLEREIALLRRRYAALLRELPEAHEIAARWAAESSGLRWLVPLQDVVEADIDVEIVAHALIVRADRTWPEPALLLGILPVPRGFDAEHPAIRFIEQTLEIRILARGRAR